MTLKVLKVVQRPGGNLLIDFLLGGISLDPGVLKSILCRNSTGRVKSEHFSDEVLGFRRNLIPLGLLESKLSSENIFNDLLVVLAVERRVAAEEDVENYSRAPDVALLIVLFLQNFRRDVIGRAELLSQPLSGFIVSCRSKIDYLYFRVIFVFVKQQVFRLHVPVDYFVLVAVVE